MAIEILLDYLKNNEKTFQIGSEQFSLNNVTISYYDISSGSLEIGLSGGADGRVFIDISKLKEAYFSSSGFPVKTPEEMSKNIEDLLKTRNYERVNINFFNENNEIILQIINLTL